MTQSPQNGDMHRHVSWMVPADVVILEFLYAARDARGDPSIQTPNTVALNTGYSNRHASARCLELADRDLLDLVESGKYRLSDRGEALLEGDLDLDELEPDGGDGDGG